jgi:hypothetical protein
MKLPEEPLLCCCLMLLETEKIFFSSIGARFNEIDYVYGDATRMVKWIDGEVYAFNKVLSTRGDYYAWIGARSTISILEKTR